MTPDLPPVHAQRTYATGTQAARAPRRPPPATEATCEYCEEIESLSPRKLGQHVAAWCPDAPDLDLEDAIEQARGWFQDARKDPAPPATHDVDDVDDQDDAPDFDGIWWCSRSSCGYGTRSRQKAIGHLEHHQRAERRGHLELRGNVLVEISPP